MQSVYRDPLQSTYIRLKAAIAALTFERPKLCAIATASLSGADFASMLERAIERSRLGRIEGE